MMRYLDGEASKEEAASFEEQLEASTELRRELALFRSLKSDLSALSLRGLGDESVWEKVSREVARPVAWLLVVGGVAVWSVAGVILFLTSPTGLWEKLATSAVVVGVLVLVASIGLESYTAWKIDPYKDVHR